MLAVLSLRQKNEIEMYAGIEAIPEVSEPKKPEEASDGPQSPKEATLLFERVKTAWHAKKGKRK